MMKTRVIFLAVILGFTAFSPALYAQTSLGGAATPHSAAVLDLSNKPNKGIGLPKVLLNSPTDVEGIVNRDPVRGLIVYNPGTAGLTAGAYFWSGASWVPVGMAVPAPPLPPPSVSLGGIKWLTYNLGADSTLTPVEQIDLWASQDLAANATSPVTVMGDLYQWSRAKDGHEKRSSGTSSTTLVASALNANGQPITANGQFITSPSTDHHDWRKVDSYSSGGGTQDAPAPEWMWNSGSDTKTLNDPCPDGFRVPTSAEWSALLGNLNGNRWSVTYPASGGTTYTWFKLTGDEYGGDGVTPAWGTSNGGLALVEGNSDTYVISNTILFLPASGWRDYSDGEYSRVGEAGYFWCADDSYDDGYANYAVFTRLPGSAVGNQPRANGFSVRCIAD
jgi:uncharacterized protein (TIGR02145 family)